MKRMIVAVVTVLVSGTSAMAQTPAPTLPTVKNLPLYNVKTVETFSGHVTTAKGTGVRADLVMMLVSTASGHRTVVLGPRNQLDPALANVAANTAVEVTGSKVSPAGQPQPFWLASDVKIGAQQYKLRDEQGRFITKAGTGADQKR